MDYPGMPRPKKSKADRFSEELRVKIRPSLKALVQQAAAEAYLDESSFIRSLVEREVRNRQLVSA